MALRTSKGTEIERYEPWGVGKPMMDFVYIHRSARLPKDEFFDAASLFYKFDADVARIDKALIGPDRTMWEIMLVWCKDFDGEDEPTLVRTMQVQPEYNAGAWYFEQCKPEMEYKNNPLIYHHKWQFVNPDYKGFDVDESYRRSEAWLKIPDLDMRKIGRLNYWNEHVVPRIPEY